MCDYIGSKCKLRNWIASTILSSLDERDLHGYQFVDACSGSGWISRMAASMGAKVVAYDLLEASRCFVEGSIGVDSRVLQAAEKEIGLMNALPPVKGFVYGNYSPKAGRKYITEDNAMRVDAFRSHIAGVGDAKLRLYLLYCLIEAFSRVMNTSGHTVSFLKEFKKRALNPMVLRMEPVYPGEAEMFRGDVTTSVGLLVCVRPKGRILYMDPPYNSRQYGNNYHLYETIARNDMPAIPPVGESVCGYRDWQSESKSEFCSKKEAARTIALTVSQAKPVAAFVSYSSDSIATPREIKAELAKAGYSCVKHTMPQKRYNADNVRKTNDRPLKEYLFEIKPR